MRALTLLIFPSGCAGADKDAAVDTGDVPMDCTGFEGAAITAEQLAATPRADPLAEGLALCVEGGAVVTDEAIYERALADHEVLSRTIERYSSRLSDMPSFGWGRDYPQRLLLELDADALARAEAGTYRAWQCLNEAYEVSGIALGASGDANVSVAFEGFYDVRYLMEEYAALTGVEAVEWSDSSGEEGEGSASMSVVAEGEIWRYSYGASGGDCAEGCTEHLSLYLESSAPGEVEVVAMSSSDGSSGETPDWASMMTGCPRD